MGPLRKQHDVVLWGPHWGAILYCLWEGASLKKGHILGKITEDLGYALFKVAGLSSLLV